MLKTTVCACRFCSVRPGEELELSEIVERGELTKLAAAINLSHPWVWRLFSRTGGAGSAPTPRLEHARRIADYFGVNIGCIYEVLARVKSSSKGYLTVAQKERVARSA